MHCLKILENCISDVRNVNVYYSSGELNPIHGNYLRLHVPRIRLTYVAWRYNRKTNSIKIFSVGIVVLVNRFKSLNMPPG